MLNALGFTFISYISVKSAYSWLSPKGLGPLKDWQLFLAFPALKSLFLLY